MGRYRSIQATLIDAALKGITDNQTVTAYKKDCKLFAGYCKVQGVKRPISCKGKKKNCCRDMRNSLKKPDIARLRYIGDWRHHAKLQESI